MAILFGSVATGRATRDSDLDLAVAADQPLDAEEKLNPIADLAEATGRLDDLIDLHRVGEPLLGQILKYGFSVDNVCARAKVLLAGGDASARSSGNVR